MSEEQRPPGEQDEQNPEQLTAPLNVERTMPIGSYPPPTGSPFVHETPPTLHESPPTLHESPPTLHESPPTLHESPPISSPAAAEPVRTPSAEPTGLRGLGAGALTALLAGALTIAMVAALFGGIIGALLVSRRNDSSGVSLPPAPLGSTVRPEGSIADISARSLPSVVTIKVEGPGASGTGSGFVMRKDGYILTNNHVVAPATATGKITVLFLDGKKADAKIIGRDESYDLAVIRVERRNLPPLVLGASNSVVVGDPVIAVGAPLGLDSTVTSGIVSALNRPVTAGGGGDSTASFINAIQTDAAINPGNSGGPLLDMAGRVIGVNSAIARVAGSQSPIDGQSGNIGVGFAIPSDQARKTAEQLIASGKATHPVVGITIDTSYQGDGVRIGDRSGNSGSPVTKGGPADKAGLRPGDVIVKFDGRPVTGPDEFVVAVRAKSVGDKVEVTVRRGSRERTVTMTLQAAN